MTFASGIIEIVIAILFVFVVPVGSLLVILLVLKTQSRKTTSTRCFECQHLVPADKENCGVCGKPIKFGRDFGEMARV